MNAEFGSASGQIGCHRGLDDGEGRRTHVGLKKGSTVAATAVLVLLAACAGEDPGPQSQPAEETSPSPTTTTAAEPECADLTGEATAQIRMDDVYFDLRCAIVSGDQKLELVNEGNSRDSFTVPELDVDVLSGETKTTEQPIGKVLKPGETHPTCANTTQDEG